MPFSLIKLAPSARLAVSAVFIGVLAAPVATVISPDAGAAYAKPEKDKKNGSSKTGKSASNGNGAKKSSSDDRRVSSRSDSSSSSRALAPNEKGRWNASNANQRALDAHVRNQNFNGTVGALSQYQLTARAAEAARNDDLESLSDDQVAALETLGVNFDGRDYSDRQLTRIINEKTQEDGPKFRVEDGVVSCALNCPEDADALERLEQRAQAALDKEIDERDARYVDRQLHALNQDSEARIIDESNKNVSGKEDDLLDGLADDLGVVRKDFSKGMADAGRGIQQGVRDVGGAFSQAGRDIGKGLKSIFKN